MLTAAAGKIDAQAHMNALNAEALQKAHPTSPTSTAAVTSPTSTTQWPGARGSPVVTGEASPCNALATLAQGMQGKRSPIMEYTSSFDHWLRTSEQQVFIALAAIMLGLICACVGQMMWRALFTVVMALVGAAIVYYEAEALPLAASTSAHRMIATEAFFFIGFAVHVGFEGSQVLAGAVLGFWGAYAIPFVPASLDNLSPELALMWYVGASLLGCLIFALLRRWVLAAVSPLLGGLLVSSAFGLLVGRGIDRFAPRVATQWFPAADEPWINAMTNLLGNAPAPCFVLQCGFSILGTLAFHKLQRKLPALALAMLGIIMSMSFGAWSMGCQLSMGCPSGTPWRWLLVGSFLWLIIVLSSMSHQLGVLARPLDYSLQGYSKLRAGNQDFAATPDNWKLQEKVTESIKTTQLTAEQIKQLKQDGPSMAGLVDVTSSPWGSSKSGIASWCGFCGGKEEQQTDYSQNTNQYAGRR